MKKKKIKLCLTKQLLNMFKLWCEWGISGGKGAAKKVKVVQHKLSIILLVRKAGASVFVCNSSMILM